MWGGARAATDTPSFFIFKVTRMSKGHAPWRGGWGLLSSCATGAQVQERTIQVFTAVKSFSYHILQEVQMKAREENDLYARPVIFSALVPEWRRVRKGREEEEGKVVGMDGAVF